MDVKEQREKLFQHLSDVLGRAEKKAKNKNTKNGDALSWNRIIIQAVSAYGKMLSDVMLDDLEERIQKLEEAEVKA